MFKIKLYKLLLKYLYLQKKTQCLNLAKLPITSFLIGLKFLFLKGHNNSILKMKFLTSIPRIT